jgi:hypothetical protein
VNVGNIVVCRPVEIPGEYSVDPFCDIDGDGVSEECAVRLWDVYPNGDLRRSFFIDMELPSP